MSLDIHLYATDTDGNEIGVYDDNTTHNLNMMADKAGVYEALWRPETKGWTKAGELIDTLETGLADLKARQEYFEEFNPANGWGDYDGLVRFVSNYLDACKKYPSTKVSVSR